MNNGMWEYVHTNKGMAAIISYFGQEKDEITLPVQINGTQVGEIHKDILGIFKKAHIPYGIKLVGEFLESPKLEEVFFSPGEEVIPEGYFKGCSTLRHIYAPNVKEIHMGAFDGCTSLQSAVFFNDFLAVNALRDLKDTPLLKNAIGKGKPLILGNVLLNGQGIEGDYAIPEHIKYVCEGAFYGNLALTSVTAGEDLEFIDKGAFERCINLHTVDLSKMHSKNIKQNTFAYTYRLNEFILPANNLPLFIDAGAFKCSGIKDIDLSMARSIDLEAFTESNVEGKGGKIELPYASYINNPFENTRVKEIIVPDNIRSLNPGKTEIVFMEGKTGV